MKITPVIVFVTLTYALGLAVAPPPASTAERPATAADQHCTRHAALSEMHYRIMLYHYHQRMIAAHRQAGIHADAALSEIKAGNHAAIIGGEDSPGLRF